MLTSTVSHAITATHDPVLFADEFELDIRGIGLLYCLSDIEVPWPDFVRAQAAELLSYYVRHAARLEILP